MKTIIVELLENNISKKVESKNLLHETSEEFIDALVLLCSRLDAHVPLWTSKEEKILKKKNEVLIPIDSEKNRVLKIIIK
jgi:hypothetical protein